MRPHVPADAGPHRPQLFREVPVSNWAGRYARVSLLCEPPGGQGGAYGGGVPRLGGTPPCPPGGGGNLTRLTLVQTIAWQAVTSFGEAEILAKEEECERECNLPPHTPAVIGDAGRDDLRPP